MTKRIEYGIETPCLGTACAAHARSTLGASRWLRCPRNGWRREREVGQASWMHIFTTAMMPGRDCHRRRLLRSEARGSGARIRIQLK